MPEFLTLTCPTCGAKLRVTDRISVLVCASCGNEHMVTRDGGAIYLAPMADDMRQMRVGVDKTAAELAIVRLEKEIAALEEQSLVHEQELLVVIRAYRHQQSVIDRQRESAARTVAEGQGINGFLKKQSRLARRCLRWVWSHWCILMPSPPI